MKIRIINENYFHDVHHDPALFSISFFASFRRVIRFEGLAACVVVLGAPKPAASAF